jgi:hypothetical protein
MLVDAHHEDRVWIMASYGGDRHPDMDATRWVVRDVVHKSMESRGLRGFAIRG